MGTSDIEKVPTAFRDTGNRGSAIRETTKGGMPMRTLISGLLLGVALTSRGHVKAYHLSHAKRGHNLCGGVQFLALQWNFNTTIRRPEPLVTLEPPADVSITYP
jgi:hypothetical protein